MTDVLLVNNWKLEQNRGGQTIITEINGRRTGVTEIRSVCGEQVLHDMNDWPRFMNNDSVSGWGESLKSTHFSLSLISLSYLGHILFGCSPLVCFFAFSFLFNCYSITLPFGVISFIDSLCLFLFLLLFFFSFLFTPHAPHIAPPGFLSWLSTLHKLKKWYICYKSIVRHWARHLVQSELHSITQISRRARALATHRRARFPLGRSPHQSNLLFT